MLSMKFCGDLILRDAAAPVLEITDEVLRQLDEMARMMEDQKGVGLAAPQVGISKRFIVMKKIKNYDDKGTLLKMINPKIVSRSPDMVVREEGCLSVLGPDGLPLYADVLRPASVAVEWTDEKGRAQSAEFSGFSARIAQHEIDHLDGVLFIDHLSGAKREMILNKVKKFQKLAKVAG